VLAGVNVWLQRQPPKPDAGAVHADILAGRSGAEVTFVGTLVGDPTDSGGHERMLVRDQLGDTLELDYNTTLGQRVPVHAGSSVGRPRSALRRSEPERGSTACTARRRVAARNRGWIQFAGSTYS